LHEILKWILYAQEVQNLKNLRAFNLVKDKKSHYFCSILFCW